MTDSPTNRIPWIDEFKGVILILVCLFHGEQSFANVNLGMAHLSAFRMTAFFFISGMLFSTRRFPDFWSYCKHKSKVLLWPYISLSLLFLLMDPVLYHFEWVVNSPRMSILWFQVNADTLQKYVGWNLVKIFLAGKSSVGSGPLWFVFTLYCISLMFYFINGISNKIKERVESLSKSKCHFPIEKICIALMAILCLALGWILNRNFVHIPFGMERNFTTIFFFALGFLCRDFIRNLCQWKTPWLLIMTLVSFCLYGLVKESTPWYSIMNNYLGKNFLAFLGSGIFGIAGLVALFQLMNRLPNFRTLQVAKGIFRNVSRNALVILAVHWWVFLVLRVVFKTELDLPFVAYASFALVACITVAAIPFFRCKFYRLLGKEKISVKESLSIR